MVVTLVFILALVVFLAFFVGHNLQNLCTFWFFKEYTDLPVTILVFIAFGAGIVLSLLCVFFARLKKSDEDKEERAIRNKIQKAESKEKKLQEKTEKKEARLNERKVKKAKTDDLNKTQEMSAADLQNIRP